MFVCGLLLFSVESIFNDVQAKSKQTHTQINKTGKQSAKTHYVIIFEDVNGRQQTYNTYAKSKDDAKHNLYQSRKVLKILNVSKR